MGISLASLGVILTDGEEVLRGLNPKLVDDKGFPTEQCFILRRKDVLDDGPSFGIAKMPEEQEPVAPLGARQGITPEEMTTVLANENWGVARIAVFQALEHAARTVGFVQKDATDWGEQRGAHCMMAGHQSFSEAELNNFRRHLTKLALKNVPVPARPAKK